MIGLVLPAMMIGCLMTSCGSGAGRYPSGSTGQPITAPRVGTVAPVSSESAPTPDARPGVGKDIACKRARVWLGRPPGAIEFTVDCVADPYGEVVGFTVGREPIRPRLHSRSAHLSGIRAFRDDPLITGAGREGRYGSCRRLTGGNRIERSHVSCEAAAKGRIRVHGRLWVEAGSRCGKLVVIDTSGAPRCDQEGETCLAGLSLARLADKVPRGCR